MNVSRTFASVEAAAVFEAIAAASDAAALHDAGKMLWQLHGEKKIVDEDAEFLRAHLDRMRPAAGSAPKRDCRRVISRFTSRQIPRSPDRQASRDRRRMLGGSGCLPANLRHHYTEGQRAVLAIIVGEVKHHGVCDLPIDQIAALAGVCRTTVQNALHEARRLGHIAVTERPQRGRKSLTNLVTITSPEWSIWLKRGSTAHRPIGSKAVKTVSPTKSTYAQNRISTSRFVPGEAPTEVLKGRRRPDRATIEKKGRADAG